MKKNILCWACVFALFAALSIFSTAQIPQGGRPFTHQNNRYDWNCEVMTMPPFNVEAMMVEDEMNNTTKDIPYRFGNNFNTNYTLENSGTWFKLANGDRIWKLGLESIGAYSLNFIFDHWYMPAGATFFIYNESGTQTFGSYTEANNLMDGTFSTYPCKGDKVYLEYYEPLYSAGLGVVHLSTITHAYRDIEFIARAIGDSGSCNNDVVCPEGDPWDNEIRSVGMIVVSGNGICSGTLINNANNDGFPYFLTANHCVGGSVSSWVIRFNFQATTCGGSTSETYYTANGTTLLANGSVSDYALLQINNGVDIPLAWSPYYSGWEAGSATPTSAVGIHHPSGDLKKISFENDPLSITGYGGAPGSGTNHLRVLDWDDGTTEGGSSGSAIWNSNHRLVGQLHGGSAACGNNLPDWYGRFFTTYPFLCTWLSPGNCSLTTLAGYDPNAVVNTLDAQLQSITAPTGTVCGTSITPVVVVRNNGTTTLTSFTLSYNNDGGTNSTYNWSGSLASGATVNITLANMSPANGAHTFNVTVSSPNGGVDQNNANNSASSSYTLTNGSAYTLVLTTDCWGEEVSWELEDAANATVQQVNANTLGDLTAYTYNFCLTTQCYEFIIGDTFGDGLDGTASGCAQDGNYVMTGPGGVVAFQMGNANYGTGTTHTFCVGATGTPGCMNPAACNYNPAATTDDGSCIIPPVNDQCSAAISLTINAAATSGTNVNTCVDGPLPSCGGTSAIKDVWYKFVHTGGNVTITTTLGTLTDTRIAVYPSCGGTALGCNDDISGTNFASSLTFNCPALTYGQTYYIQVGGYQSLTGTFSIQVTSTNISGCTNPLASNYNACANVNDGSCIIPGCTDAAACNYNAAANQNNGTCTYPGCMDASACNYNASAGCAATCNYPVACNNPTACNYTPGACMNGTCNFPVACNDAAACNYTAGSCMNGTCTYPGCTDSNACNYNAMAGCSNGSCTYAVTYWGDNDGDGYGSPAAEVSSCLGQPANTVTNNGDCDDVRNDVYPGAPGTHEGIDNNCNAVIDPDEEIINSCVGDFDDNGVINTNDLLLFMAQFGCMSACGEFDLTSDDVVNTSDLLLFMGLFGTVCP